MKLLANENFPLSSVKILKDSGFDMICVGIDFSGILDSEVMQIAMDQKRTILTFDRDYGELIFKKGFKPEMGVIYLRWNDFQPETPGEYLRDLFSSGEIDFTGKLTVISEKSIRQRKY